MVPTVIMILQSMPLTPNGKINHAALPAPVGESGSAAPVATPSMRPLTDMEIKLVEVWTAVLRTSIKSVEDNFFDLGGHSLLATKLVHH